MLVTLFASCASQAIKKTQLMPSQYSALRSKAHFSIERLGWQYKVKVRLDNGSIFEELFEIHNKAIGLSKDGRYILITPTKEGEYLKGWDEDSCHRIWITYRPEHRMWDGENECLTYPPHKRLYTSSRPGYTTLHGLISEIKVYKYKTNDK